MVEHVAITDPNIHDTKGVAAASNGQVHAKVGGNGTWVDPSTLASVRQITVLEGATYTSQNPGGTGVPIAITFGGAQAGTDVSIDGLGTMTINTTGMYHFKFNLSVGRVVGGGEALVAARLLVNGSPTGFVQGARLPDANSSTVVQFDVDVFLPAATTVQVQFYRDAAGANAGGLIGFVTGLGGWDDVPSAWVRIARSIGVTN